MRRPFARSFRRRLSASMLVASLVPLLLCSAMLLQIFRLRMSTDAAQAAREYIGAVSGALDEYFGSFSRACAGFQGNRALSRALDSGRADAQAYNELLSAAEETRSLARIDLYGLDGRWVCSTQRSPERQVLPVDRGALYAAGQGGGELVWLRGGEGEDTALFQGAAVFKGPEGQRAGYLLVSIYQENFRQMLEGKYGAQNNLILLSRYWRAVYCAQPSLAASLAPELRRQLLDGQTPGGASEDFRYTIAFHAGSGLYLVLRQPQVFTRETMILLYTVSLFSALICVAISVLMSLVLSRQMFRPVQRLHQAIGQVEQNNLDVLVPTEPSGDELGELAERFNNMVAALKRNQEQLVDNQRKLNEAQIRMLQAQLNPHFLCNTLDTMKWISKINKVPQVALMSTDLADILRFCISPEEFVTLDREVEILQRYIEIQKIRLSDSFRFSMDIPLELEDCLLPKMLLQPLVENAILHGLDGVEDGALGLEVRAEGRMMRICVWDNGHGLPESMTGAYRRMDSAVTRGHVGLYNVDTILLKHYGEGFGLYLDNRPGGTGAAVTAAVPIRREEEPPC